MAIERIWLTGFMGTGKSRIARPLAAALDWTPLDIDTMIEREAGDSIAHIFKTGGEGAFRALEAQAVDAASRLAHVVVATGGGTVLSDANVELMRKDGFIVCLDAQPETIYARIMASEAHVSERPLLAGADPLARIRELKADREPLYRAAQHYSIETDHLTPDEITHAILLAYRERTAPASATT
jgi:shikimate kinase